MRKIQPEDKFIYCELSLIDGPWVDQVIRSTLADLDENATGDFSDHRVSLITKIDSGPTRELFHFVSD